MPCSILTEKEMVLLSGNGAPPRVPVQTTLLLALSKKAFSLMLSGISLVPAGMGSSIEAGRFPDPWGD
jgi:hypothetical protein